MCMYIVSNGMILCGALQPFAVLKYGCVAGIMVTVSHNPKQNNDYKVYLDNRAQVGDTYCT